MAQIDANNLLNLSNFTTKNTSVNILFQQIISQLVRATNRHKISYDQLRFIFKSVREKCEVEAPRKRDRLFELATKAELDQFYSVIENSVHKLIFEVLEGTGLRIRELCNLKISQIDFDNNMIKVIEGKGRKDRITVMGEYLKEKLKIYLSDKKHIYLFESRFNKKFSTRRLQQVCREYLTKSLIESKITCHTFRHIWNTKLAMANIPREKREILAGHSSGSKTQDIYTHLSVGGIKDEVIKILDKEK
jgi:integrase